MPPIWFLRHGETEWNAARRIQGQLESMLTERGIWHAGEQAKIMKPILAQNPRCIVSPLLRARRTAEIALGDAPFDFDPRLMEIDAGSWQGLCYSEVIAGFPELVNDQMTAMELFSNAPDGEGFGAFKARIRAVLDEIEEPTVIVAHGLWGQVARGTLRGLDDEATRRLDNMQGVVYLLENGTETILRAPS